MPALPPQHARILIVESFKPFREFVSALLRQRAEFHVIDQASDGSEAVQKAQQLQPDLILLDVRLESLSGIEVANHIREIAPATNMIFVSLESSPEIVEAAFNAGASGYVYKLNAYDDLLTAIDAVLAGKRFISPGSEFSDCSDAPSPHHHEIVFCSDDDAILDSLARFIAAALNDNNAAMACVTKKHRDNLIQRLRTDGVDIDGAMQRGTYISADAAEKADLLRIREAIKALKHAATNAGKKHPRVALCGERAGRLWADGKTDEAMRLEHLCGELAEDGDIDILCQYPSIQGREDDPALKKIYAEHSTVSFR